MSFTPQQVAYLQANRDSVEARRTFQMGFQSGTVRMIEGSTLWNDGTWNWFPSHGMIKAEGIKSGGAMEAHPATYIWGYINESLSAAHINNENEWRGAVVIQRLVLFVDGVAVGPAIHLHRGKIEGIRRLEDRVTDQFEVRVEGPFQDRNTTILGRYTDRDQQMRSPGDRGAEYTALYETSGAEFTGWIQA